MTPALRDFLFTVGTRVFVILPGLVIQSVLARWLGPDGRGAYQVCLTFIAVLTVVGLFGLDVACQYFLASKRQSISEAISATLLLSTIGGVLVIIVGIPATRLPLSFFDQASDGALWWCLAVVPTQMWCASLLLALSAIRSFRTFGLLTAFEAVFRLVLVWLAVVVWSLDVEGALIANGVSGLITSLLIVGYLRRECGARWVRPSQKAIGELLGYSARYYLAALSIMVSAHIGTMILGTIASARDVGLLGAAMALVMQLTLLPDAIATVLHPRIADDPAGRPEMTAMCARGVAVVCGAMFLGIAAFASMLVPLFFGPEFERAVAPLQILSLGGWVRSMARIFVPFLNATNRPGIGGWATFAGVAVNVVLLAPWYRTFGLEGAAWAITSAYFVHAAIVTWAFCHFGRLGLVRAFAPNRRDVSAIVDALRSIGRAGDRGGRG